MGDQINSSIRINPWIGDGFNNPTYNAHSMLVLGESHYDENSSVKKDYTVNLICNYIRGTNPKTRFWTNVAQLISGIHNSAKEFDREKIWHDFAFYNYIQEIVGDHPRIDPDLKKYRQSEAAFFDVINKLKPELVIVLGTRLFNRMYPLYERKVTMENDITGRMYNIDGHKFLATKVRHPSAGFSYKKEHKNIKISQEWLNK